MKSWCVKFFLIVFSVSLLSGCSVINKLKRADELEQEVAALRYKLQQMNRERFAEKAQIDEKEQEISDLEKAKEELARSLQKEIGEYKAKLEMTERGLVITFLAEVFFDSGKDVIRKQGKEALQKIAPILNTDVPRSSIAIEGHTDSDPIKRSTWKSNWELSSARALAVLHYLIDEGKVSPKRLSANGYGEFRPVASNDTPAGKQKNRRVEIVILPSEIKKIKSE
jgi:chemotaxis protein MotB